MNKDNGMVGKSFGTEANYIIFPLMELIKKEIDRDKSVVSNNVTAIAQQDVLSNVNQVNNSVVDYSSIYDVMNSFEYDIELFKNDENFPGRLSSAVITYSEILQITFKLIREDVTGRLQSVDISIKRASSSIEDRSNPYGMLPEDYRTYVLNGAWWGYYNGIVNDPLTSPTEKDAAVASMMAANQENITLRGKYGVRYPEDALSLDQYLTFMNNPYLMYDVDYAFYCLYWQYKESNLDPEWTQVRQDFLEAKYIDITTRYGVGALTPFTAKELRQHAINPWAIMGDDLLSFGIEGVSADVIRAFVVSINGYHRYVEDPVVNSGSDIYYNRVIEYQSVYLFDLTELDGLTTAGNMKYAGFTDSAGEEPDYLEILGVELTLGRVDGRLVTAQSRIVRGG